MTENYTHSLSIEASVHRELRRLGMDLDEALRMSVSTDGAWGRLEDDQGIVYVPADALLEALTGQTAAVDLRAIIDRLAADTVPDAVFW
ncbi:hypothetical protein [Roseomonas genomospecies 6]|uniref:Uncharacterized protein n=1 Tax=Roseomonas genomospecies 6 TaxID=214106 RepID=A0A9W7NFP2_9PROT|nr:hypothetical protein [Roseomonas genomospecies 6]KAA0677689.1 hypothetical protein DS843_22890 [Roseomonas genomospecies 6]